MMTTPEDNYLFAETIEEEEVLRLEQRKSKWLKSLEKKQRQTAAAADELGISERTLYRKIKQFDL
jgi:transcriptional regulator of acetoin/glycerol metabolism